MLYQFAPTFKCDLARLDEYLPLLPNDVRFAFEFRHASWLTDAVYERLGKSNIALCLAESDKLEVPKVFTADFGYFRLRKGDYGEEAGARSRIRCAALLAAAAMRMCTSSTRTIRTARCGPRS